MLRNSKNDLFWKDLEQLAKILTRVSMSNNYFIEFKCLKVILVSLHKRVLKYKVWKKNVDISS